MLLMSGQHPQRRRRSRPLVFCAFIEAQRRALRDAGAQGISATEAQGWPRFCQSSNSSSTRPALRFFTSASIFL